MIDNAYYSQENHGPYEVADIGDFTLEDGGTNPHCKLAYATFGTLNRARDNAILVTTWYTGTSKIARPREVFHRRRQSDRLGALVFTA